MCEGMSMSGGISAGIPDALFSWNPEDAETPPASLSFTRGATATVLTTTDGTTNWYQTAKSGEVRYEGLRRVENLLASGGIADLSTQFGASKLGDTVTFPGSAANERVVNSFVPANGRVVRFTITIQLSSGSGSVRVRTTGLAVQEFTVALDGTEQKISVVATGDGSSTWNFFVDNGAAGGPYALSFDVIDFQLEQIQDAADPPSSFVNPTVTYNAKVAGVR